VLRPGLTLNRIQIPVGDCIINWESYVTHAKVKFMQHSSVLATAEGRWVKSDVRYDDDAVVYRIILTTAREQAQDALSQFGIQFLSLLPRLC
jgi:hypothetical protein